MKKNCKTCEHWKRYMPLTDMRYCLIKSRLNFEVYTLPTDKCECWKKWNHNFKKFRDSIKPKTKIGL
jgi:hypothetical protein